MILLSVSQYLRLRPHKTRTIFLCLCCGSGKNALSLGSLDISASPKSRSARVFYEIYHGKAGVLPSSNCVDLIETLEEVFHSEELMGQLWKVNPNESGS